MIEKNVKKSPRIVALGEAMLDETHEAFPAFVDTVADTWDFMTGEEMPNDVKDAAFEEKDRDCAQPSAWSQKFKLQQDMNDSLKSHHKRPKVYTDEFSSELVEALELPGPDKATSELVAALGRRILEDAYTAYGPLADESIKIAKEGFEDPGNSDLDRTIHVFNALITLTESAFRGKKQGHQGIFNDSEYRSGQVLNLRPCSVWRGDRLVVRPSCLLQSIMVASFLRKVGVADLYHVGIPAPLHYPYARAMDYYCDTLLGDHDPLTPMPMQLMDLLDKQKLNAEGFSANWQPHSATAFAIGDVMSICDPYQPMYIIDAYTDAQRALPMARALGETPNTDVLYAHDISETHDRVAWAMEASLSDVLQNLPSAKRWGRALDESVLYGTTTPLLQLLEACGGSPAEDFYQTIISGGFFKNRYESVLRGKGYSLKEAEKKLTEEAGRKASEYLAIKIFGAKSTEGKDVHAALMRCDRDSAYRGRVVDDLRHFPQRLMMRLLQDAWSDATSYSQWCHPSLDMGSIEHRVGAATLLDVSHGLDLPVPISVWARQWASQLPWMYSEISGSSGRESAIGSEVLGILRSYVEVDDWHYRQYFSIVSSAP